MFPLTAALLLVAGVPAHADDPVTVSFSDVSPATWVMIVREGGGVLSAPAGLMNIEIDGEPEEAFCVDLDHGIAPGDLYEATLAEMSDPDPWCAVNHILTNADWSDGISAAAVQVALWKLVELGVTANEAAIETAAVNLLGEAEGLCPLTCLDELSVAAVFRPESNGLVYAHLQFSRGDGSPVSGEELLLTVSSGSVVGSGAATDDDGRISVVLDPMGATSLDLGAMMEGSTVYRIEPTETETQLMAYIGDECSAEVEVSWEAMPLGDPHSIGFWKHEVAVATGATTGFPHVTAAELEQMLPFRVFNARIADLDSLYDVLWVPRPYLRHRALQQCAAMRLNVEWGAADWHSLVDLDGDGVYDGQVWSIWAEAQEAYFGGDPGRALEICEAFNLL